MKKLKPGDTLGIIGGGQLGRILSMAAMRLGLKTRIFENAWDVAPVDMLTYEFENLHVDTIQNISETVPIRPSVRALEISQHRLKEKEFLSSLGIPVAFFVEIDMPADADGIEFNYPGILKTVRMGYDGKGQIRIGNNDEIPSAWAKLEGRRSVLEELIEFECECSVIAVRDPDGNKAFYAIGRNEYRNGILIKTTVPITPSDCSIPLKMEMEEITAAIMDELDYVGVIAVEFFIADGKAIVNEFAPRVHNSGHWTLDGCRVSQFENHVRAIAGWPLGSTDRFCDIEMENLLGNDIEKWQSVLSEPDSMLHLYGKNDIKPDRKMGHVNRIIR